MFFFCFFFHFHSFFIHSSSFPAASNIIFFKAGEARDKGVSFFFFLRNFCTIFCQKNGTINKIFLSSCILVMNCFFLLLFVDFLMLVKKRGREKEGRRTDVKRRAALFVFGKNCTFIILDKFLFVCFLMFQKKLITKTQKSKPKPKTNLQTLH